MKSYYCDGFRNCVLNCRNFVQVPCFHTLESWMVADFALYLHQITINSYSINNLKIYAYEEVLYARSIGS